MNNKPSKYFAFISYSTNDKERAEDLHFFLEKYRLPSIIREEIKQKENRELPETISPIFRDVTGLPPGELRETLQQELAQSKFLIVVCSPESAKSPWVNREVECFIELGRYDNIIPYIISGKVEDTQNSCYPPILRQPPIFQNHPQFDPNDPKNVREQRRTRADLREQLQGRSQLVGVALDREGEIVAQTKIVAKMLDLDPSVILDWEGFIEQVEAERKERAAKIAAQKRLFWRRLYLALGLAVAASLLSAFGLYFTITDPPPIIIEKEIEKAEEPQLTAYYADYIEKFGMPIGILPLTDEQVQHRNSSVRIKSKGGITNEVAYVNSRGKLTSPGNSEYVNRFPLVKYEYSTKNPDRFPGAECYDEDENLLLRRKTDIAPGEDGEDGMVEAFIVFDRIPQKATLRKNILNNETSGKELGENQNATPLSSEDYFAKATGKRPIRHEGNPTQMAYERLKEGFGIDNPETTVSSAGTVTKFRVVYTAGGEEQFVIYYRGDKPIKDFDETFGRAYQYNEEGRIREIICLNEKGRSMNCSFGWAKKTYEYDDTNDRLGNFKSVQWRDTNNQYVLGELKMCRFEADFDRWGNHREERYYKPSSQEPYYEPTSECVWCIAMCKFEYNNDGDLEQKSSHNADGTLCLDENNIAYYKIEYDNNGNSTKLSCFGIDGLPCSSDEVVAGVNSEYEEDNETKRSFFGEDGKPCLNDEGIAGWNSEYEENNETKRSFFGVNGEPVALAGDDPCDSWEATYHENDEMATITWYYMVKAHKNGCRKWVNTYNEEGNHTKVEFFGEDGKPCLNDEGVAGWKSEYEEDNETKRSFFGVNGEPVALAGDAPYDSWEATYHENSEMATITWYYMVKPHPNGCEKWVNTYNEDGNRIKIEFFSEDGNRCLSDEGVAGWNSEYEENNETKRSFFCVNGEPVALAGDDPFDSWEKTYHENNKIESQTRYYNVKSHKNGYQKKVNTYNEDEKLIKVEFFGLDGKPCLNKMDIAGYNSEYDDKGNEIKVSYFGLDRKPSLNGEGIAGYKSQFDELGNESKRSFFDLNDEPVALGGDDPFDSWEKTYHENGKPASQTWYYNVKQHPNGCRKWVCTYDEDKKLIKVEFFGETGNRCLSDEGVAGWNSEYKDGNEIKRSFFGVNGESDARGGDYPYDSWEKTYIENGKIATQTFYYSLKSHPNGCRKLVNTYNRDGNRIKIEFFDETGNRCLSDKGVAGWNSEYKVNNETKHSYFDLDDEPVALGGDDPYDSWEETCHENGKTASQTWYYSVKPHPNGCRKWVNTYDEEGNLIKEDLFDEEGKKLIGMIGIKKVFPDSQAESLGLKVGDIFLSYDGKVFDVSQEFIDYRKKQPEEETHKLIVFRDGEEIEFNVRSGLLGATIVPIAVSEELFEKINESE